MSTTLKHMIFKSFFIVACFKKVHNSTHYCLISLFLKFVFLWLLGGGVVEYSFLMELGEFSLEKHVEAHWIHKISSNNFQVEANAKYSVLVCW